MRNLPVPRSTSVRTAVPEDAPALERIAGRSLRWDPDAADLVGLLWPRTAPGSGEGGDRNLAVVAQAGDDVVGFAFGSLSPPPADPGAARRGHVNLLAVEAQARRRGHGRALLAAMEERLVHAGAARLLLGGAAPRFAWPGIDVRYTAAGCLAQAAGYVQHVQAVNMTVELSEPGGWMPAAAEEKALARQGITLRPLHSRDGDLISPWLASWGGTWREEALATLDRAGAGCHIAVLRDGSPNAEYVGFACHGVNRADWFGPMGTSEALRGRGIGGVLLRRCLADIRARGHETAQIGWTGPVGFYARAVDAYVERVFCIYRKEP